MTRTILILASLFSIFFLTITAIYLNQRISADQQTTTNSDFYMRQPISTSTTTLLASPNVSPTTTTGLPSPTPTPTATTTPSPTPLPTPTDIIQPPPEEGVTVLLVIVKNERGER